MGTAKATLPQTMISLISLTKLATVLIALTSTSSASTESNEQTRIGLIGKNKVTLVSPCFVLSTTALAENSSYVVSFTQEKSKKEIRAVATDSASPQLLKLAICHGRKVGWLDRPLPALDSKIASLIDADRASAL